MLVARFNADELRAEALEVIERELRRTHPSRIAALDRLAAMSRDRGVALMAEGLRGLRAGPDEVAGLAADLAYIGATLLLNA